jgi:hypothetical protein
MATYIYGIYDIIFGYYTRIISIEPLKLIDKMNLKRNPDRVIGDDIHKINTLT